MATPPQGGQYSQYPPYSPYPQAAAMPARPPRPAAMQRAVILMYAGAALAVVGGVVSVLTTYNVTIYDYSSPAHVATTQAHAVNFGAAGLFGGIIQAGLWLWMAWKTGAGRKWARVLSSVFFGFACLTLLVVLFDLSQGQILAGVIPLALWGVGLAAIIYLWSRESSAFFAAANQAAAYGGYQPYGQQPPYGQPGYGQPPYGQAPPPPPNS